MPDNSFVGVCSCGFITADCKTRDEAALQTFGHTVKTLRSKQS